MPLFHRAIPPGRARSPIPLRPFNVADRLQAPRAVRRPPERRGRVYYGESRSLVVYLDGDPLNPYEIEVATSRAPTDRGPTCRPPAGRFARPSIRSCGRIALPPAAAGSALPKVKVSYHYGFNADLGGGEYPRADTFLVSNDVVRLPVPRHRRDSALYDAAAGAGFRHRATDGQRRGRPSRSSTARPIRRPGRSTSAVDVPAGCTLELRAAERDASDAAARQRDRRHRRHRQHVRAERTADRGIGGDDAGESITRRAGARAAGSARRQPQSAREAQRHATARCVPGWSVDTGGTPRFRRGPDAGRRTRRRRP